MNKKIKLVILLLVGCALLMLGLQLYFNYNAYQNNERTFKIGVNSALAHSVTKLMNIRRDEFANQYKRWMLDTGLIAIGVKINAKDTVFSIRDKQPVDKKYRPPFTFQAPQFKLTSPVMTPRLRTEFVEYFIKNFLYNDFSTGRVLFFTTSLGEKQSQAFERDHIDLARLSQIYQKELAKEDIHANFQLSVRDYNFEKFDRLEKDTAGTVYTTRPYLYGFGKQVALVANFPNIAKASLAKMKWLIFSSLILIAITIACFAYTLETMLSQKKLATLKDDFVNNMTHELKTPIATISIAAEAMDDFQVSRATAKDYLTIIRFQAKNISNLIDQLLNSLLIGQASLAFTFDEVLFNEMLDECLIQHQPQFDLSNASIKTYLTDKELVVNGDRTHLANMIINLIDNAVKYSKGTPQIELRLGKQDEYLIFKISNRTDEIPNHYATRLFEKFFRVPKGNLHEVKGYGLGLSYVAHVVEQHKGKIDASVQADLITFNLMLPLK